MRKAANATARRVQRALGVEFEVLEFERGTRTADDAAAAIGCTVAQIAKSMIFRTCATDRSILVVVSGVNRVEEKKVVSIVGEDIGLADAAFVRERTGYSIGGVAPIGHVVAPTVLLDEDLSKHKEIWAAAGTPNAVFKLTPDQLQALTGGRFLDVARP